MKKYIKFIVIFYISVSIGQSEGFTPEYLLARTQEFIKNEEWDKAKKTIDTLMYLIPDNDKLYFNRGFALQKDSKYQESISDFTKVISLNPELKNVRTSRALSYQNLGEYENAIADFTGEIEINPNPYSYEHRAYAYYLMKNYDKAMEDINIAIKNAPQYSISYKTRAQIYNATGFKEKACQDKEIAIQLNIIAMYPRYTKDIENLNDYCSK